MIVALGRTRDDKTPRPVILMGFTQDDMFRLAEGDEVCLELSDLGFPDPMQVRIRSGHDAASLFEELPPPMDGGELPMITPGPPGEEGRELIKRKLAEMRQEQEANEEDK